MSLNSLGISPLAKFSFNCTLAAGTLQVHALANIIAGSVSYNGYAPGAGAEENELMTKMLQLVSGGCCFGSAVQVTAGTVAAGTQLYTVDFVGLTPAAPPAPGDVGAGFGTITVNSSANNDTSVVKVTVSILQLN